MAALKESLFNEMLHMLMNRTHRTGTHPLRNFLKRGTTPFLFQEFMDVMQDCLLAFGKIYRLHGIKVGERRDAVNPFFSLFFNLLIFLL